MNKKYYSFLNHAKFGRDFLLDLIFPIACLACGQGEKNLCGKCKKKIIINKNFSCLNCNTSSNLGACCKTCQTKHGLDGLWISSDYHNKVLSSLIKKFKYSFNKKLAPILAKVLILFLKENNLQKRSDLFYNLENLIIVPVPLHKSKQRLRGFNQSELLARLISEELNININSKNLTRRRNTKAQAKLNKKQRLANVNNAFNWTGKSLKEKNIILIDDVSSTGATLNNCTKTLKANGAQNVWGLVLAKN